MKKRFFAAAICFSMLTQLCFTVPLGLPISAKEADCSEYLVLQYDFENEDNLAEDSYDADLDGKAVGALSQIDGVRGKAVHFGSTGGNSDAYVEMPAAVFALPAFTVMAWCRYNPETVGSWARVFAVETANSGVGYHFSCNSGNTTSGYKAEMFGGKPAKAELFTNGVLPYKTYENWHHVALSYDGKTLCLYVNGGQIGSVEAEAKPDAWKITHAFLGKTASFGDATYLGDMDDARVYGKALTGDEIAAANGYVPQITKILENLTVGGETPSEFTPYLNEYDCLLCADETRIPVVKATASGGCTVTVTQAMSVPGEAKILVKNAGGGSETVTVRFHKMSETRVHPEIADVQIDDAFWNDKLQLFNEVTAAYVLENWVEKSLDGLRDFDRVAAGERNTGNYGGSMTWGGSDFYASMAGAARLLMQSPNQKLQTLMDGYVTRIYAASESSESGYLSIYNLLNTDGRPFGEADQPSKSFDLFNLGYLIECGISWYQATGDARMLRVAIRYLNFTVAYSDHGAVNFVSNHTGAEYNIIELYEFLEKNPAVLQESELADLTVNTEDYRELVTNMLSDRGVLDTRKGWTYGTYANDHKPYDTITEADGHAVIALLYYNALAEMGRISEDVSFPEAAVRLWEDIVNKQMYVTGGTGATYSYEGFGGDYYLPDVSYCESCTSGAMLQFSDSLSSVILNGKYQDDVELQLYNTLLGSVGEDGCTFFYTNPLEAASSSRWSWHGCPCCTKYALMVYGNLPRYIYSMAGNRVYAEQYVGSTATLHLTKGDAVLTQTASWAEEGKAQITVVSGAENMDSLSLRLPAWSRNTTVKVNGKTVTAAAVDGYLTLTGLKNGDTVTVEADMTPTRVYADENVTNDAGKVALRRGVMIYCYEGVDNNGTTTGNDMQYAVLPADAPLSTGRIETLCGGVTTITSTVRIYADADSYAEKPAVAVPFFARSNREASSVHVWVHEDPASLTEYPPVVVEGVNELKVLGARYTALTNAVGPRGSGSQDVGVIADGKPHFSQGYEQYDTFGATLTDELGKEGLQWFGIQFEKAYEVSYVDFWEGGQWSDGGWFGSAPYLQVLVDGQWKDVAFTTEPAYPDNNAESQQPENELYRFVLAESTSVSGVRVVGKGNNLAGHVSCAEIEVYGVSADAPSPTPTAEPTPTLTETPTSAPTQAPGDDGAKEKPVPVGLIAGIAAGAAAVAGAVLAVLAKKKKKKQ